MKHSGGAVGFPGSWQAPRGEREHFDGLRRSVMERIHEGLRGRPVLDQAGKRWQGGEDTPRQAALEF